MEAISVSYNLYAANHQCLHTLLLIYRLVPSTGKTKELSANNCKDIKEALPTDCTLLSESGVYWVQDQQVTITT